METPLIITRKNRRTAALPKSWTQAIGLLKGREVDALKYQREVRQEWETRFQKLIKKQARGH